MNTAPVLSETQSPIIVQKDYLMAIYESELKRAEKEVSEYKRKLSLIRRSNKNGIVTQLTDFDLQVANLKWRAEIRNCINLPHKTLMTSNEIASCVAIRNNLTGLNRNIKTKISSTLSMMFKEGEIGRALSTGEDYLYGRKEYFESDLKTVLPKWINFLERDWK